jgi:antitoxin (DNA-binding transcriptional repressor) of toxin-antitoxin stability system
MMKETQQPLLPPQRIGMRALRENFAGTMREVQQGASFLVTSRDEVIAIIQPPQSIQRPARKPGTLRGKIHMPADFDTLPADVLAAMEADTV